MSKIRYHFEITKPICRQRFRPCKWEISYGKTYGSMTAGSTHCENIGQVIDFMARTAKEWAGRDDSLMRKNDKVTDINFHFESCIKTITKGMMMNLVKEEA